MRSIEDARYGDSAKLLYGDIIAGGEFGRGERARVGCPPQIFLWAGILCRGCTDDAAVSKWKKVVGMAGVVGGDAADLFRNNRKMGRGSTADVIKSAKKSEKYCWSR